MNRTMLIPCTRIAFSVAGLPLNSPELVQVETLWVTNHVTRLNLRFNSHLDVREGRQIGPGHLFQTVTACELLSHPV